MNPKEDDIMIQHRITYIIHMLVNLKRKMAVCRPPFHTHIKKKNCWRDKLALYIIYYIELNVPIVYLKNPFSSEHTHHTMMNPAITSRIQNTRFPITL